MLKASDTILWLWPQAAHKENLNYSLNYLGTIFYAMRCYWEPTWGKNPVCAVFERLFQNFVKKYSASSKEFEKRKSQEWDMISLLSSE